MHRHLLLLVSLTILTACGDKSAEDDDDAGTSSDSGGDSAAPSFETITGAHGGRLVRIPAMSFDMGCTPNQSDGTGSATDCQPHEQPVMPVTLTYDFYIGETEVTQDQYQAIAREEPSYHNYCRPDCPVDTVSWHDAAAFTNALSEAEGLPSCYACTDNGVYKECEVAIAPADCAGYRLPTEAEWEGSARCGTDQRFAGSDNAADVCWHDANYGGDMHYVALLQPNECGLYDQCGNVEEWVHDWFDENYYTAEGRTDPAGPESGRKRVKRGGEHSLGPEWLRLSRRRDVVPSVDGSLTGFRIARTAR